MPLRGAILQIKRKKSAFFIKKNDYKGMKIEINCTGSDTIQLHELTEFQGELKERSDCDVIRRRWTQWAEENGIEVGSGALR